MQIIYYIVKYKSMEILIGGAIALLVQFIKRRVVPMGAYAVHFFVFAIAFAFVLFSAITQQYEGVSRFLENIIVLAVSATGVYEIIIKRIAPYFEDDLSVTK